MKLKLDEEGLKALRERTIKMLRPNNGSQLDFSFVTFTDGLNNKEIVDIEFEEIKPGELNPKP